MRDKALSILSLFASTSTLICCALPVLLVTLGFGAVVAGAVSSIPGLVFLSQHSGWVFAVAGMLIGVNWVVMWRWNAADPQDAVCEAPEHSGKQTGETACETGSRFSRVLLWISTALYAVGFTVAYLAMPVADFFGWIS